MKRYIIAALLCMTLSACNKMVIFENYYVAFVPTLSSSTIIDATGEMDAEYHVHLCSVKPSAPVIVDYAVIAGNGLKEGVDYQVVSKGGKLNFYPGIYDLKIKIKWLSNGNIDTSKDNTVTIRLESVNQDILLGEPGPSKKNKEIIIRKQLIN